MSDWYEIPRKEVVKRGGRAVLDIYPSLARALKENYPDYAWETSKFANSQRPGYWAEPANLRALLEKIGQELDVQQVSVLARSCIALIPPQSHQTGTG